METPSYFMLKPLLTHEYHVIKLIFPMYKPPRYYPWSDVCLTNMHIYVISNDQLLTLTNSPCIYFMKMPSEVCVFF